MADLGVRVTPNQSETSQAAALTAWPRAGTQRAAVLEDVAAAGEYGCTDEELDDDLGLGLNTIRPRRGELAQGGWLRKARNPDGTVRTRPTRKGGDAEVWVVTEAARARLGALV